MLQVWSVALLRAVAIVCGHSACIVVSLDSHSSDRHVSWCQCLGMCDPCCVFGCSCDIRRSSWSSRRCHGRADEYVGLYEAACWLHVSLGVARAWHRWECWPPLRHHVCETRLCGSVVRLAVCAYDGGAACGFCCDDMLQVWSV